MISSVIPLSARNLDKRTVIRPADDRVTPAFRREAANASGNHDVKASRSFGVQEKPHPSLAAGFVRQAPAKAENKDETPGVLGDIAMHTRNSAGEFMGAIARSAPSLEQVRNAAELTVHGLNGAGAGVLLGDAWGAISGHPLTAATQGALVGAGAVMATMLSPALSRRNQAAPDHPVS